MDVSRTKLCLDTFIFMTSNSGRRKYYFMKNVFSQYKTHALDRSLILFLFGWMRDIKRENIMCASTSKEPMCHCGLEESYYMFPRVIIYLIEVLLSACIKLMVDWVYGISVVELDILLHHFCCIVFSGTSFKHRKPSLLMKPWNLLLGHEALNINKHMIQQLTIWW